MAVQYADLDAAALVVLGVPHIVGAGSADGVGQLQLRAGLVVIQVGDLVIPGQVVHLIQSDVDQDERGVLADVEDILLVEMVRRKGLVLLGVQCPGRETLGLYVVLHCVGVFFIGGRGGDRHGGRGFQAAEGRRQRGGGEQAGARRGRGRGFREVGIGDPHRGGHGRGFGLGVQAHGRGLLGEGLQQQGGDLRRLLLGSGAALLRHRRELEQEQQQRADADPVSQALFPIGFPLHVLELPLSIVACMPFPATA